MNVLFSLLILFIQYAGYLTKGRFMEELDYWRLCEELTIVQ